MPRCTYVAIFRDGNIKSIEPLDGVRPVITKRIIKDLNTVYYPEEIIVPSTEVVHDRAVLELFRGCIRGCRFCQAGHTYRPSVRSFPTG